MKRYRIATIPGDGIGNEVVPEGQRVLEDRSSPEGFVKRILKFTRFALWSQLAVFSAGLRATEFPAVEFRAADIDGVARAAAETGAPATVWVFVAHDCPICNAYAPLLARLAAAYGPRGVRWLVVYSEPGLGLPELRAHARAFGYTVPLFADPKFRLARSFGVTVTPEAVILDAHSRLVYRGRIDDLYPEIGHQRLHAQTQDLRDALDEVLQDRPVTHPRTTAIGCALETPPEAVQGAPLP